MKRYLSNMLEINILIKNKNLLKSINQGKYVILFCHEEKMSQISLYMKIKRTSNIKIYVTIISFLFTNKLNSRRQIVAKNRIYEKWERKHVKKKKKLRRTHCFANESIILQSLNRIQIINTDEDVLFRFYISWLIGFWN